MDLSPKWTEPIKTSHQAQYPLGLNIMTDRMSGYFLPGITTITYRARYYSFYAWALDNIRQKESFEEHAVGMYERDKEYSLACKLHELMEGDHATIIGGSIVKNHLGEDKVSTDFKYLRSGKGGFDNYSSPLASLNILNDEYEPPRLTKFGLKLAKSFRRNLSKTSYKEHLGKEEIPQSVLKDYAKECCLCQLSSSSKERENIIEALFSERLPQQKNTLLSLLYIIEQVGPHKERIPDKFLESAYYGHSETPKDTKSIHVPEKLEKVFSFWRVYKTDEYLIYSLRHLFSAIIEELDDKRPLKLDQIPINEARIQEAISKSGPPSDLITFSELLEALDRGKTKKHGSIRKKDPFLEKQILQNLDNKELKSISEILAKIIMILALIYYRSNDFWNESEWVWYKSLKKNEKEPNVQSVFHSLPRGDEKFRSFGEKLVKLVFNLHEIHREHLSSNRQMWIERHSEEKYKRVRDYDPQPPVSRLSNSSQILEDLDLFYSQNGGTSLTEGGKKLLEEEIY